MKHTAKRIFSAMLALVLLIGMLPIHALGATALKITKQPTNAAAPSGSKASVTVKAAGDGLTYKWYYKNNGASKFTYTSSYKTNTYTLSMNADRDGRQVYCVVTDQNGKSVKSNTVTLYMGNPGKITTQPTNSAAPSGSKASVTVKATGDGLTYKWYYKNKGASKFTYTSSYKTNTYTLAMNADRDGRQVYCVVTDKYGKTVKSDTATLYMGNPVKITQRPTDTLAPNGSKASVTVKATGDGLTYKWYYKNKGADKFTYTSSYKTNTYTLTMNAERDGRQVYCVVTDKYGITAKSGAATFYMGSAAQITRQPVNVGAATGQTASVTVEASGEGLTYKWYYKNKGASDFAYTGSFKTNTYSVKMNEDRDGRQVYCVVTDRYGNSVRSNTATLYVADTLIIVDQSAACFYAESNEEGSMFVSVAGGQAPYFYSWEYAYGEKEEYFTDSDYRGPVFWIEDGDYLRSYHYRYRCVITDTVGRTVTSEPIYIYCEAPVLKTEPNNAYGKLGDTLSVSFKAEGEDLTYRWYYKDAGADKFSLTTAFKTNTYKIALTKARAGRQIYCVVTDRFGHSVQTRTVTLDAPQTLAIRTQPQNIYGVFEQEGTHCFEADVVGGTMPYTYVWYYSYDGENWEVWPYDDYDKYVLYTLYEEYFTYKKGLHVYYTVTDATGKKLTSEVARVLPSQPQIVEDLSHGYGKIGETVSTAVTALGQGLTYQWYYKDADASKFSLTTAFKTNTYSIKMTEARKGRQVYCVITDSNGKSVKTKTVTLNTPQPLSITNQLQDRYAKYYSYEHYELEVYGGTPPYEYEWESCEIGSDDWDYESDYSYGGFPIREWMLVDGCLIRCTVTDAEGNSVTSNTFKILPFEVEIYDGPERTDGTMALNSPVELKVKAYGEGLTYSWYAKAPGEELFTKLETFTGDTYTNTMTQGLIGYQVYCIVTDSRGNAVKSETVTFCRPLVTTTPSDVMLSVGDTFTITADARNGIAPYTYSWQTNRGSSNSWYDLGTETNCEGTYTNTLTCRVVNEEQLGYSYRLKIKDAAGNTAYTKPSKLFANDKTMTGVRYVNADSFLQVPESRYFHVGDDVTVEVELDGRGSYSPYTYQWQVCYDGVWQLLEHESLHEQSHDTWGIAQLNHTSTAAYPDFYNVPLRCLIEDSTGSIMVTDSFVLTQIPEIVQQPADNISDSVFDEIVRSYYIEVRGGLAPYTFTWCKNTGVVVKTETTQDNFSTLQQQAEWMADFYCIVTDAAGYRVASREASLTHKKSIQFYRQPVDSHVQPGRTAVFTAMAGSGTGPFSYQWECIYDGADGWESLTSSHSIWASGYNTTKLCINVSQVDWDLCYRYRCKVTDAEGRTGYSREVQFTQALKVTGHPADVAVAENGTAQFTTSVTGGRGPYTFKWEYKGDEDDDRAWEAKTYKNVEETSNSYSFTAYASRDGYYYRCVITDAGGSTVTTDWAKLTIGKG